MLGRALALSFGASFGRLSRVATEFASDLLEVPRLAAKRFHACLERFTNLLLAHSVLSAGDEDAILVEGA